MSSLHLVLAVVLMLGSTSLVIISPAFAVPKGPAGQAAVIRDRSCQRKRRRHRQSYEVHGRLLHIRRVRDLWAEYREMLRENVLFKHQGLQSRCAYDELTIQCSAGSARPADRATVSSTDSTRPDGAKGRRPAMRRRGRIRHPADG